MSTEVEETLKRVQSHKGVEGVIIMTAEGISIKSTLADEETESYCALVSQLAMKAGGMIRILDESDELAFLRVRSTKVRSRTLSSRFSEKHGMLKEGLAYSRYQYILAPRYLG